MIVILDGFVANSDDLSWEALESLGNLKVYARTSPEEVVERAHDAFAVFTNKVVIDEDAMRRLPKLKFIGVLATGYNNVDVEAAAKLNITVCNVPSYSTESVAQLTFALLLELTNRVGEYSQSVDKGEWGNCKDFSYRLYPITELSGLTMGVLGFGNIGQRVGAIAQALGMNVITTSQRECMGDSGVNPQKLERVGKEELFRRSDVLSLNSALTAYTANIINAETLRMMRRNAIIINTSRGGLVDEQALANALDQGQIAGAGLDVLQQEPPRSGSPLIGCRNCIITPHVAWQSTQARERLIAISAENLRMFIDGKPQNVVS